VEEDEDPDDYDDEVDEDQIGVEFRRGPRDVR